MPEYTVTICYTAFDGDAPARIRLAHDGDDALLLEKLFAATGTYGALEPELWDLIEPALPADRTHTSLSVGDTVVIARNGDAHVYRCEPIGWTRLADGKAR